jgi:hypothetical protein
MPEPCVSLTLVQVNRILNEMDQAAAQHNYDAFEGKAQELNQLFAEALSLFQFRCLNNYGLNRYERHPVDIGWNFDQLCALQKFLYEEMNNSFEHLPTILSVVKSLEGFAEDIGLPLY